jgi:polysaccharide deacetylase family protein (PEP-CTERM system associated)
MMINALSFDLEEWYHPEAIRKSGLSPNREQQAAAATIPLLDLLQRYSTKATFFTVGEVAEQQPQLIERILNEGHELAFHGWTHAPLWALDADNFAGEIERFLDWQRQNFPGIQIHGYRAPTFSLDHSTAWAIRVLKDHGFTYDSSVFPAKTSLYGVPDAPRITYWMSLDNPAQVAEDGLLEVPMSVFGGVGYTGGLYLRFFPLPIIKAMMHQAKRPAVMYIHPWETYSQTPRLKQLSPGARFVLYHGLPSFGKLEKLLQTFQFDTMQAVFKP